MTNKTILLFFNIVFLYFNTLFNWYINLTIDGTIYPSQNFQFVSAFVCQAGNFWTLLRSSGDRIIPFLLWLHYPKRISVSSVLLLQPSFSCSAFLQLSVPIFLMIFPTSSFRLALCLPVGHLWCKLAWYIFLLFLASSIRCLCRINLRRPFVIFQVQHSFFFATDDLLWPVRKGQRTDIVVDIIIQHVFCLCIFVLHETVLNDGTSNVR